MPIPPQAAPPTAPLGKAVTAIGWAANILAAFCLYDALREGLGAYQYHTAIPLLAIYKGVLGIYAAARQAQQWREPEADIDRGGHYFVLAWLALPLLLNALEVGRLWDPPPIQPADLSDALNWVLGFYVFGKVTSVVRTKGFKPLGILPRRQLPPEKEKLVSILKLAVDVLGAVCLFDVLREAITPPNLSVIDIHGAYRSALAAYAGTRAWRLWAHDSPSTSLGLSGPGDSRPQADPEAEQDSGGHWWVAAWLLAAVGIKGVEMISSDNLIVMPRHLAGTLLWVFSIYGLGFVSELARKGSGGRVGQSGALDAASLDSEILSALEGKAGGLKAKELAELVGCKKDDLKRPLRRLMGSGLVGRVGKSPNDPNTIYRLAKYGLVG
jgi:hypothetical protein